MQSQVRFYITQDDDQAVVRSIPVLLRPVVEQTPVIDAANSSGSVKATEPRKVSKLVRSAVKLGGPGK